MADETTGAVPETDVLWQSAQELPAFRFEEGDVPVLATTKSGGLVKIPERALGRAANRGIVPLEGEALAERQRTLKAQQEQAGILPAVIAGAEEALSTATFGATDAAIMGLAELAGTSKEEYLRARAERQAGSPIAAGIGTAVGLIAPAVLTGGESLIAEGALGAAAKAAGTVGVGGVMRAGQAATKFAGQALGRALPSVMTAEELSAAYRAARAVEGVAPSLAAAPGLRATAATALRTGAERAAGGAVEGLLWGSGEAVRESILGKPDNNAEAIASQIGTDVLLFSSLGGGLGVMEAGLPMALNAARKVANRVYDAVPAFGRDTLRAKWAAQPGRTGVLAETAEELFRQRERLVAIDKRFAGALDSMAAVSPDAVRAAASHVDAVEALAASRKGTLDAVLAAPAEVRDAILENATTAVGLEARAKGAIEQMLASTPDRLEAAFSNAAAFDALVAGDRNAVGRMLELRADILDAALANAEGIAALEEITGKKALGQIARMQPDAARWYVENAGKVAELENGLPGYWQAFRGMTEGADSRFAVAQADDVLNNWRLSLTNPNERARVLTSAIEQKTAELAAGEELAVKLYQASLAAEGEAFLKVGEIGGPPSLERVQQAIGEVSAEAERLAKKVSDPVKYDAKLAKELQETSDAIRRDFVGVSESEAKAGITADTERFINDPKEAFYRLRDHRTALDDRIRDLKAGFIGLSTAEKDTLKAMEELRASMTSRYHDPAVFGDAATIRARSDDAFRQFRQATEDGGLFDKKFRETVVAPGGKQVRVIARQKVNQWLNQIGDARASASVGAELGDNSSAWNAVSDAFSNLIETTQQLLPKVGKSTVEISPEALQSLAQRTIEATKELEQRGFYTRTLQQMKLHVDGGQGLNLAGLQIGTPTMGGFPHGVATAGTSGLGVLPGTGAVAPEVAAVASAATAAASAVPGGGIAAKGVSLLTAIPTMQRQVTARVRGMVAIEKMGRDLADNVERGAQWLIGQASGKRIAAGAALSKLLAPERQKPGAGATIATPRAARRQATEDAELDRSIREANRLAGDPTALAIRLAEASDAVAADLPETTSAVGRLMTRAAAVVARAAPVPEGQPLDQWQPSAADRAAVRRVVTAASNPMVLYQRALDGTLTKAEVDAVAEVMPGVLGNMRAAAQAYLEAARVEGSSIPFQRRTGIETLLGYPLTRGRTPASVQAAQASFGAVRAGQSERPSDGMAQPLPGASRVTLGNRFLTPQQQAAER